MSKLLRKHLTPHGNCITFNHKYTQATAGPGNGLRLGINIMQDYYTEVDTLLKQRGIDTGDMKKESGLNVFIYSAVKHIL